MTVPLYFYTEERGKGTETTIEKKFRHLQGSTSMTTMWHEFRYTPHPPPASLRGGGPGDRFIIKIRIFASVWTTETYNHLNCGATDHLIQFRTLSRWLDRLF